MLDDITVNFNAYWGKRQRRYEQEYPL
jgi:hypothetical protein